MRRQCLTLFVVVLTLMNTVAPLYAHQVLPPLMASLTNMGKGIDSLGVDRLGHNKQPPLSQKMVMPCHKSGTGQTSKTGYKNEMGQMAQAQLAPAFCFSYCLSYLNKPCLSPGSVEVSDAAAKLAPLAYHQNLIDQADGLTVEVLSTPDPPFSPPLLIGASSRTLLLKTSRLRH